MTEAGLGLFQTWKKHQIKEHKMAQLQLVHHNPVLHNMKTCFLRAFFEAEIFMVAAELIALASDVGAELDCILKRCK